MLKKLLQIIHRGIINYKKLIYPKKIQSGGFLGRPLGPLMKVGFLLMKNAPTTLAKYVLIPLILTAAVSVTDDGIYKKILGSRTSGTFCSEITIVITSNK